MIEDAEEQILEKQKKIDEENDIVEEVKVEVIPEVPSPVISV
jgi:hypothetical protein